MKPALITTLLFVLFTLTTSVGRTHRPAVVAAATAPAAPGGWAPGQLHRVRTPQAGRLWEVYVQPGEVVQRGQLLAKVAIPLHSLEQQAREAQFQRRQQHYRALVQRQAPAAALTRARRELVEAGHRVAGAPKVYSFAFITAPTSGTVQRQPTRPGQYLTDSSTVALLVAPRPAASPPPGLALH
jgi:biotin carboxyl carrier protein